METNVITEKVKLLYLQSWKQFFLHVFTCRCSNSFIIIVIVFLNIEMYSLQSFAIPGSISLSILSGFLFPFWQALFLVCFVCFIIIIPSVDRGL